MPNNDEIERDAYVEYEVPDEYKIDYIEFINRLMDRMRMKSIERMLDAALKEVEIAGGV